MIDSVPASAPSTPPDTGASTTRTAPDVVSANRAPSSETPTGDDDDEMISSRSSGCGGQDPVGAGQHLLDLRQVRQHQQQDLHRAGQ